MARPGFRPHRAPGGGGSGSTGDTGRPRRRLRRLLLLRGERGPAYRGAGEREPAALPGGRPGPGRRVLGAAPGRGALRPALAAVAAPAPAPRALVSRLPRPAALCSSLLSDGPGISPQVSSGNSGFGPAVPSNQMAPNGCPDLTQPTMPPQELTPRVSCYTPPNPLRLGETRVEIWGLYMAIALEGRRLSPLAVT